MKQSNRIVRFTLAVMTCLAAGPAFAYTASDLESKTGGTFLNFRNTTTGESRGGIAISPLTLGANVADPRNGSSVNWSLDDSSDGAFFIDGKSVEDNNRRSGLNADGSPVVPVLGPSYTPFSVTLSGLTPGAVYGLSVVGLGRRSDPVSDPGGLLDGLRPDVGIGNYDFSYGASAGSLSTFANSASGTLLWESIASSAVSVGGVNYYYYTGSYACDIGNWTANGSGEITLFVGEGAVNTVLNGSRTMLDGVVVNAVPEPATAVLLCLAGLAVVARRQS